MALIEKLVGKVIKTGRLTLVGPDGRRQEFGPGGGKHLTVRVADRRTAFAIAQNPRIGLGEAYMDGRITIEDGDILDLMQLVTGANRVGGQGQRPRRSQPRQAQVEGAVPTQPVEARSAQRRPPLRHRQRLLPPLPRRGHAVQLRVLHRPDQQPRSGAVRQEGAHCRQARPQAGPARARHRLRLGRDGSVPESGRRRSGDRRDAVRRAAQDRAPASRGGRRLPTRCGSS